MVLDALVPIIKASRVPSCFVQRQDSLQFSAQVARNEEKLGNGTTSSLGNGTTSSTNHHFGLWTFLSYFASLNQTRNHIHIHHIIPYPSLQAPVHLDTSYKPTFPIVWGPPSCVAGGPNR